MSPFNGFNLAAIDWDVEAIREMLGRAYSPDIELTTLASGLGSGVNEFYRGLDGLVRYLREWLEPFSEYHVENLDYVEAGECVLIPVDSGALGPGVVPASSFSSPPSSSFGTVGSPGASIRHPDVALEAAGLPDRGNSSRSFCAC